MRKINTADALLDGKVVLEQPAQGYRAAIDPVLLAASVPAKAGQTALDLGCGAGAAMFCLAARVPGLALTGVELMPEYAACARANIIRNDGLGIFHLLEGDARKLPRILAANSFDHAFANPPYHDSKAYDPGPKAAKAHAHAMTRDDLAAWIKSAHGRLKRKGTLTIIYRADGLADLLEGMAGKFGGLAVMPLWPKSGIAAKRVIVRGIKESKAPLQLLAGMVLHKPDGSYTDEAEAILRGGWIEA
ncbi:MAG: methyltransferase [Alphaproteobacteria bacterium]